MCLDPADASRLPRNPTLARRIVIPSHLSLPLSPSQLPGFRFQPATGGRQRAYATPSSARSIGADDRDDRDDRGRSMSPDSIRPS